MSRFGSREISDVVLKDMTGKPALYLETLKTSSVSVEADTTYAVGGKGAPRLIAWNGSKTVTFNCEDALISPESLSVLIGNELKTGAKASPKKEVLVAVDNASAIEVTLAETPKAGANLFVFKTVEGYDIGTEILATDYTLAGNKITFTAGVVAGEKVIVDYYYESSTTTKSVTVTSDKFPGYYSLEAKTLFRRESDGVDVPANFIMPKVKIQPGFEVQGSNEGDPAVFSFVMDCFPNENKEIVIIDILE